MTNPLSAWAVQAASELPTLKSICKLALVEFDLELRLSGHSLWLIYYWPNEVKTAFRVAFSAVGAFNLSDFEQLKEKINISLDTIEAKYNVEILISAQNNQIISWTTNIVPKLDLLAPFWPKDMLSFTASWQPLASANIHAKQIGNRSGIIFYSLTKPQTGNVFYFQNISSFNLYFIDTETTGSNLVGGNWPEIGLSLPPTSAMPLKARKSYIISDAVVCFSTDALKNDREICKHYLTQLAQIYPKIKRPEAVYHDWLGTVEKGLSDLANHAGCWKFADGHHYLNAYVSDYDTPPEIMVQLAVLCPLIEYMEWKGEKSNEIVDRLKAGLPAFYKKDMGTIVRWLPKLEKQLDHSEEQKKPNVMDSWYLYHPLMNLVRLAKQGEKVAKQLLMDSIDYAIKVARTFEYQWPVFYQMETLKIIKAETAEGEGGELDVPGSYADVMIKMWEFTKERKYLTEAKRAVRKLEGLGFSLFYQANNTAYGAVALLKLFKETNDSRYLEMSYVNLAGIFNNVQLWEMDYGNGKNFSTFFSIFPLKDAPYTAAYEEQEVYAALSEYLQEAQGIDILPEVRLLIAEFIKYIPSRISAYYPPALPEDMLTNEPKTGEIDRNLWVAIEDLQDGRELCGQVGQEVYGAGVAFGIVPRQYIKLNKDLNLFVGYPIENQQTKKQSCEFKIGGDERFTCNIIIEINNDSNYEFNARDKQNNEFDLQKIESNRLQFTANGNQSIILNWKNPK